MIPINRTDLCYILIYFSTLIYIGQRGSKGTLNIRDFMVGNRNLPWWAVLGSIVATEISALTFLGVPAEGFRNNLTYLQFGIGSLLARFVIAYIFIPQFYAHDCLTIYSYLEKRFGGKTRYTAACSFVITRLLASSVRLLVACTGLSVVFSIPLWVSLSLFTLIATLYTLRGGIKAIIWTDLLQGLVFIGGGLVAFSWLQQHMGWDTLIQTAQEAGKWKIFDLDLQTRQWFNAPTLLPLAIINGFLMTLAALGTDQDLSQRMLTCKNDRAAKRSIIFSGFVGIPVAALFLLIGVSLYSYLQSQGLSAPENSEHVFAVFIRDQLPNSIRGLLLIGIFAAAMSSLDSAMGALSSSMANDLYKPLIKRSLNDAELLKISRYSVLLFAILLGGLGWLFRNTEGFLWLGFKIVSITYGGLLGVFLSGLLTQRGNDRYCLIALLFAFITSTGWLYFMQTQIIQVAWTWLILWGTCSSFVIAIVPPAGKKISSSNL